MGKGDKRTKRGKIARGSYGKSRPHKQKNGYPAATAPKKEEEKEAVEANEE